MWTRSGLVLCVQFFWFCACDYLGRNQPFLIRLLPLQDPPAVRMQSTANYLWLISDLLGQGATANVYRGRHKVRPTAGQSRF